MPNRQVFPRLPNMGIYDDDAIRSKVDGLPDDLADARLTQMLNQVTGDAAKELERPIQLLGFFEPMQTLARVKQTALDGNGKAALVVFDEKTRTSQFFWDHDADDSLNNLIRMKMDGAWLVGIIVLSNDGWAGYVPEPTDSDEQNEFCCRYLDTLTSIWRKPQLAEFYGQAEEATTILNGGWDDSTRDIHDEIILPVLASVENGQEPKHAR